MKVLLILTGASFFTSCEEKTSWNFQESEPIVIVDALITNELKNHTISVYYSSTEPNMPPEGIRGAKITLKNRYENYQFSEDPTNPGNYISEVPFRGAAGILWRLVVETNGRADSAEARMVAITLLPDPEIVAHDSLFRYVYSDDDIPSMTTLRYDWSSNPEYCSTYGSCKAAETFYTLHELDVNEVFAPEKQIIAFPPGTTIYRSKYSLSAEHQDFIRSLLLETEWRGGFFDTEQGNVPTNFRNGFRGWFALCMEVKDTIQVN